MPSMIDHMSLPVAAFARSAAFYDAALGALGYVRAMEFEHPGDGSMSIGYGPREFPCPAGGRVDPALWIVGPAKEKAVAPMPGFHVAVHAESRAAVDAFYAAALKAGGTDNGKPGLRLHYHANYYAAFVIDPDGHHVEAVCHKPMDA